NKVDRAGARPLEVSDEVLDLFIELDADEDQIEFPTVYAAGRDGWAIAGLQDERKNLTPLLEMIVEHIPAPIKSEGPVQMLCTALDHNDYVGRIGIGRVFRGSLITGEFVAVIKRNGSALGAVIKQIFLFEGLGRREVERAECGDICAVVGLADVEIGDTLSDPLQPEPLSLIAMDEPTLTMSFLVNTSPFFGKEGRFCTSRKLRERLYKETERDMALRVEDTSSPDEFKVSGRGILHLSILMENMRREGYEFMVGQPRVIYKEIDGRKAEPVEVLTIDVATEHAGAVIEYLGTRKAEMVKMVNRDGRSFIEFRVPSRGLIGFRSRMLQATSGEIVLNHRFFQYEYFKGSIPQRQTGSIISMARGAAVPFALDALQDRGRFFVEPGDELYPGQVIGESPKEGDIVVNAQKTKKLTNMRAAASDRHLKVAPAVKLGLEECLEHVGPDEYVEVTPASIRMRKALLDENDRKRAERASAKFGAD
ncbi:EF-Tu/IF-2/RF-3 family GTPase, partial [Candidatus Eisenbacteria bacterium]